MRDIRTDLQERADLAQDQIKAVDLHFKRMAERLQIEHDASVAELKALLTTLAKLIEFENRRMPDTTLTPQPSAQHPLRVVI